MRKNLQTLFGEYMNECEYITRLRPETVRNYKAVFRLFILLMPEITNAETLDIEMTTEFFKRLQTRVRRVGKDGIKVGIKDSTFKTYWSKLNSFFEWLFRKGLIRENPLRHIRPPQPVYEDQRALEEEEVHKIIAAITLHPKNSLMLKRDLAMVYILLFCGIRFGEFVSLRVQDVDFGKHLMTVRGETSKSKKTRLIPIHPTLMLHLQEYIKERNKYGYKTANLLVSTNNDQGLTRAGVKHWVKRLITLSGVKFHLHRFRHTFACNLAMRNINAVKIQKLMGHADIKMTMVYLRSISTEDLREDIHKLSI